MNGMWLHENTVREQFVCRWLNALSVCISPKNPFFPYSSGTGEISSNSKKKLVLEAIFPLKAVSKKEHLYHLRVAFKSILAHDCYQKPTLQKQ